MTMTAPSIAAPITRLAEAVEHLASARDANAGDHEPSRRRIPTTTRFPSMQAHHPVPLGGGIAW